VASALLLILATAPAPVSLVLNVSRTSTSAPLVAIVMTSRAASTRLDLSCAPDNVQPTILAASICLKEDASLCAWVDVQEV